MKLSIKVALKAPKVSAIKTLRRKCKHHAAVAIDERMWGVQIGDLFLDFLATQPSRTLF